MAIAGSPGTPSAGFALTNRQLVQVGLTQNKPHSAVVKAVDAAAILLFNPAAIVQMDVRYGVAERVLRLHLKELDLID